MHSGEGGSYYGLVVVARIRHGCGLPCVNLKNPHRTASIFLDIGEKIAGKQYRYSVIILKGYPGPLE